MSQESRGQIQNFLDWKELGYWSDPKPENKSYTANNPLCGDLITMHCEIVNHHIRIESMEGEACSVCLASAGILYHKRETWDFGSLNSYLNKLEVFLNDNGSLEEYSQDEILFWGYMKSNPGRHRCAFLPFHALKKAF